MAINSINGLQSGNDNEFKLILSSNCLVFNTVDNSSTVTVSTPNNGQSYAVFNNTNVAAVTVNNNIITITSISYESALITIGQNIGTGDYVSITSKIACIMSIVTPGELNSTSWQTISIIAQADTGLLFWLVGDTKDIVLNGQIGDYLTLTDYECKVFILHFNYPNNKTITNNNIIFSGFKFSTGLDIALSDEQVSVDNGHIVFNYNHWGEYDNEYEITIIYNYGRWKDCNLRHDILGAVSTLPSGYGTINPSIQPSRI